MSAREVLTAEVLAARLPGCLAKLAAIKDHAAGKAWSACGHVVDGDYGMLCTQHPAAGVLCQSCLPHHVRRHPVEVEFRCDECAEVVDVIRGLAGEAGRTRLLVRDTRGRRRPMPGRLWLIGLGVCEPCWQASERTAP